LGLGVCGAAAAADTPLPSLLPTPAVTADAPIVSPPVTGGASSVPAELPPPLVTGQPTAQPVNPPPAQPETPPKAEKPPEPQPPTQPQQQNQPTAQPNTNCDACQQPQVDTKWHDDHQGPCEDWWLDAGYRALWIKDMRFQSTLVTSNGATLFGNQDVSFDSFNGVYANGGFWLNCRRTVGIEINGFFVDRQDVVQTFASDANGSPAISRPITDALRIAPVNVIVSAPNVASGSVTVDAASRFASAGINGVWNVMQCDNYSVNALYGFRYIDLEESVDIAQTSTPLNGGAFSFGGAPLPAGVGMSLADDFHTRNQFYGGLAGTRGEWRLGPLFVGGLSTISFGPDHQTTEITGLTTPLAAGFQPLRGGLLAVGGGSAPIFTPNGQIAALAQQGNVGRYTTNRFIIAPEVGAELGIYVTNGLRLGVAYNFLYMSEVTRPNRQIDTRVNQRFVPASPSFGVGAGQPLPLFPVSQEDFHVNAVTFTAEVRW
jgi:hypothetical protein